MSVAPQSSLSLKVYLSYSHRDQEMALLFVKYLAGNGIEVLYDENLLKPGDQDWERVLTAAMEEADAIIALVTPISIESKTAMRELEMAHDLVMRAEGRKLLLPVIKEVSIPSIVERIQATFWRGDLDYVLQDILSSLRDFQGKLSYKLESEERTPDDMFRQVSNDEKARKTPPYRKGNPDPRASKRSEEQSSSPNNSGESEAPYEEEKQFKIDDDPFSGPNFWLLKMRPETWYTDKLNEGEDVFFNTFYNKIRRPEYDLFFKVKEGDRILGLATGVNANVFCEMVVTGAVYNDRDQGEMFTMKIVRILERVVNLYRIEDIIIEIAGRVKASYNPPELFFTITQTMYDAILALEHAEEPISATSFIPSFLTEGNHKGTDDKLGFTNDIQSFASVMCLEKVTPPLAIGLFGNWGTGKSFFMEKLYDEVLVNAASNNPDYVKNVVQVRFNSWHYSDANLWASMITEIFESLNDYAQKNKYGAEAINKIRSELNITSHQLEETQQKIAANEKQASVLQDKKTEIDKQIADKEIRKGWLRNGEILKAALSDPGIQADINVLNDQFADKQVTANITQIEGQLEETRQAKNWLTAFFKTLREMGSGKMLLAVLVMIAIPIATYFIGRYYKDELSNAFRFISTITAFFITAYGTVRKKITPYLKDLNKFYARLDSLKTTIENTKSRIQVNKEEQLQKLTDEIGRLNAEKDVIELKKQETEAKQTKLQQELRDIGSGKLLASFLATKTADDTYLRQLGIISWIRKDFARLNDLFKKQNEVKADEKGSADPAQQEVKIDRIILYIDDLDRCNEDVVVKVLEAIHLLLAFPLFVVVVGVDPRWLNNAITKKYRSLFGLKNSDQSDRHYGVEEGEEISLPAIATSYDYLEKIFQVPFSLKPIRPSEKKDLIQYLMKREMEDEVQQTHSPNPTPIAVLPHEVKVGTGAAVVVNEDPVPVVEDPIAKLEAEKAEKERKEREEREKKEKEELEKKKKEKFKLTFSKDELAYMQSVSDIFGHTPRTINRYVNIYRIIKAHGSLKVTGQYSEDDYAPIMFLLAVIVGHSALAEDFIEQMLLVDKSVKFGAFLNQPDLDQGLIKHIKPHAAKLQSFTMEHMRRNIELVSRFSFRSML